MTNFIKKFNSLFKHERSVYINAARVNDTYKKIVRGSNQIDLINHLKLDYIIVIRRGKGTGTISNIDINSDQFKPSMHNVFVKLDQLNRHKELSKRLKTLPDINNEYDSESDNLSEKFKAKGLLFDYTDESGKNHNELIEVGPKDDSKVKTIYKQTVSYFPSKENDLCKLIAEINTQHELALLKMEFDYTKQLRDRDNENNQLKASIEIQRLTYENKLLSMELVMNKLSLTK